jgi:hypothetical protein
LTNKKFSATQVAENFDFLNPLNVINALKNLEEFSEIDYSLSYKSLWQIWACALAWIYH